MDQRLVTRSLVVLEANQAEGGGFLACPDFATYRYVWFRDGAMCAHALSEHGRPEAAGRFFAWGSTVILWYRAKIERCIEQASAGAPPPDSACLHSRFTTTGQEVPGHWGHHQLDGLGSWLWALGAFARRHPDAGLSPSMRQAADLAAAYLRAMWPYPCSDCWEENEDGRHTYTLAAVAAGLRSHALLSGAQASAITAAEVLAFIRSACVQDGIFTKSVGTPGVDANLLGLVEPFGLVEASDPTFRATLEAIQASLVTPGVHRYLGDRYYGGGEWVLLTAWLGWVLASAGRRQDARACLTWVEAQASPAGDLPEQVPHRLLAPDAYATWVGRWGPIATPLLWSHAQHLLLVKALAGGKSRSSS